MRPVLIGDRLVLNEHGDIAWPCRHCACWNEPVYFECQHCWYKRHPVEVVYAPSTEAEWSELMNKRDSIRGGNRGSPY